ncbi:MAG: hypothetical protein EOM54_11365 [Clostridia bacterium]|nr:hypothetical protein [Clostridia bacterium]
MESKKMGPRQSHGVNKLSEALLAVQNKEKGIVGNVDEINKKLQIIMAAINNPVPNRVIDDE